MAYTCFTQDDYDSKRHLMKHIFYCNYDYFTYLHPVANTQEVFEISSTSNTTPNGVMKVRIASLQCLCTHCRGG